VPAAVAEILGLPSLTYARFLEVDGDKVTAHREHEEGWDVVESSLPAIVSVVEAINEPRYPSFKGIMAAKSKPLDVKSLADLGVDAGEVGMGNAAATIYEYEPRPPKAAGGSSRTTATAPPPRSWPTGCRRRSSSDLTRPEDELQRKGVMT
jgi:electron transfer flavoprotein beta subunit